MAGHLVLPSSALPSRYAQMVAAWRIWHWFANHCLQGVHTYFSGFRLTLSLASNAATSTRDGALFPNFSASDSTKGGEAETRYNLASKSRTITAKIAIQLSHCSMSLRTHCVVKMQIANRRYLTPAGYPNGFG